MARRMVKAPQRGHLNSMTLACPLARSLPHWQHLISSRTSFRIMVKIVAPPRKSVYRASCLARDDTDRRILCMRGLVLMWGRGGLVRPVGGGVSRPRLCQILSSFRLDIFPLKKEKLEAAIQRRPARSERKNALFPRNDRPDDLKRNAFQTEIALKGVHVGQRGGKRARAEGILNAAQHGPGGRFRRQSARPRQRPPPCSRQPRIHGAQNNFHINLTMSARQAWRARAWPRRRRPTARPLWWANRAGPDGRPARQCGILPTADSPA